MPGLLQKGVLIIKKASLTVEAALIFPIFFFAFIAFIYIIMWFQTAEKVQQIAHAAGLQSTSLVWNTAYKGIDDWQLALRQEETKEKTA